MVDYRKLYYRLFGALADAVEALEQSEPERAKALLIAAQQDAEDLYITAEESQ